MLTQTQSSSASAPPGAATSSAKGRPWRIVVTVLLTCSVLLLVGYSAVLGLYCVTSPGDETHAH